MKFNTDEVMKEFDELVNEVRRDMPDPDDPNAESNWEGPIRRFGQQVLRDDEFFTITDFGNIKAFFTAKLQEAYEQGRSDCPCLSKYSKTSNPTGIADFNAGEFYK